MNKRFIAFMFLFALLLSACVASAATRVSPIPSFGVKQNGDLSDLYGGISYNYNGNMYRYVLNSSGQNMQPGYPLF